MTYLNTWNTHKWRDKKYEFRKCFKYKPQAEFILANSSVLSSLLPDAKPTGEAETICHRYFLLLFPQLCPNSNMRKDIFTGKVTSINHEKNYVSVAYIHNDRKKTITCRMSEKETDDKTPEKIKHVYRVGDEVSFQVKGVNRGANLIAYNLKFLYNNELQKLLDKAAANNRFTGYLKRADDALFIKERGSYIFFPLEISKWEKAPTEEEYNEPVEFRLLHTDKPGRISAELFNHDYIPDFRKAIQAYKHNTPVEAVVTRISPYAIYLDLYGGNLQSKLPLTKGQNSDLKVGDTLLVRFSYLGNTRIVTERV